MNKYIILSAVVAMALASCSTADESTTTSNPEKVAISLTSNVLGVNTRSASTNLQATQIAANNPVGIYIYDNGQTAKDAAGYGYENYLYTPDGNGALTLATSPTQATPYYSTFGSVDIYGYAPRLTDIITGFTTPQTFFVQADQTTEANYIASDLIYGNTLDKSNAFSPRNITFSHKLCKINITLIADGTYGFQAADLSKAQVTLFSNIMDGTINLSTGEFIPRAASSNPSVINVFNVADNNNATSVSGSAIIIPQTIPKDYIFIGIGLSNEDQWSYYVPDAITFQAGYQYNYTITMKNFGISVKSSITPWNTTNVSGDAFQYD